MTDVDTLRRRQQIAAGFVRLGNLIAAGAIPLPSHGVEQPICFVAHTAEDWEALTKNLDVTGGNHVRGGHIAGVCVRVTDLSGGG